MPKSMGKVEKVRTSPPSGNRNDGMRVGTPSIRWEKKRFGRSELPALVGIRNRGGGYCGCQGPGRGTRRWNTQGRHLWIANKGVNRGEAGCALVSNRAARSPTSSRIPWTPMKGNWIKGGKPDFIRRTEAKRCETCQQKVPSETPKRRKERRDEPGKVAISGCEGSMNDRCTVERVAD